MVKKMLVIILMVAGIVCGQVTTETNRMPLAQGDGGDTTFTFDFSIIETSDLLVITRTTATGVEVVQTETTHYTVSATNNDYSSGGTVTFVTAPAATEQILLIRNTPMTQTTDYDTGTIRATTHSNPDDKQARLIQELAEEIERCIKIPRTDIASNMATTLTTSVDRANSTLVFSSTGAITAGTALLTGVVVTAYMETLLDDGDAATARATLELSTTDDVEFAGLIATTGTFSDIKTLSPWIDVTHSTYGAVADGDGSGGGTDNATAFQAAITAAANGELVIPPGTYRIDSALVSLSKITIRGFGKVTLDFTNISGATIALKVMPAAGMTEEKTVLENFIIKGPETDAVNGNITTTTTGLYFDDVLGLRIVNVESRQFKTGMFTTDTWPITTVDCKFIANYIGMQLDDDCTIGTHSSRFLSNFFNLYIHLGVTNQTFTSCDFENAGANAITCDPDGGAVVQVGMQFINPYFENTTLSNFVVGMTLSATPADSTGNCLNFLISGGVGLSAHGNDYLECSPATATVKGFTFLNVHGIQAASDITGDLKAALLVPSNAGGSFEDSMYWYDDSGTFTTVVVSGGNTYTETNVTPDRAFDADSTTTAELADVLGTLIVDLRAKGLVE